LGSLLGVKTFNVSLKKWRKRDEKQKSSGNCSNRRENDKCEFEPP